MPAQLTILNSMVSTDFPESLDRHAALGLKLLELKDAIFGKGIADLTLDEARRAKSLIEQRRLGVYCLCTQLLLTDVELGEAHFRRHLEQLDQVILLAKILQPKVIRLLAASTRQRTQLPNCIRYLQNNTPWIIEVYRDACDRIKAAGFIPMIENDINGSIFSTPAETIDFFKWLNRPAARLIWDIGNMWQMKTYPSLEGYLILRSIIGSVHLKGGIAQSPLGPLAFKASLADTTWPVINIVKRIVSDNSAPVITINFPHGPPKPGYDYRDLYLRDLKFLRENIPGLA